VEEVLFARGEAFRDVEVGVSGQGGRGAVEGEELEVWA